MWRKGVSELMYQIRITLTQYASPTASTWRSLGPGGQEIVKDRVLKVINVVGSEWQRRAPSQIVAKLIIGTILDNKVVRI